MPMIRIACEQGLGAFIPGAGDVHLHRLAIRAEHELRIRCDGQAACARGGVFDSQSLYADRVFAFVLCGNECQKCLLEGMSVVFEFGVSLSVTRPVCIKFPYRQRRGCPEDTAVFVVFFSSRRRHTRSYGDWSSDVCSSDLGAALRAHRRTRPVCVCSRRPTSSSARRCWEMAGRLTSWGSANSPTVHSPSARRSIMARRIGWASAANTSSRRIL